MYISWFTWRSDVPCKWSSENVQVAYSSTRTVQVAVALAVGCESFSIVPLSTVDKEITPFRCCKNSRGRRCCLTNIWINSPLCLKTFKHLSPFWLCTSFGGGAWGRRLWSKGGRLQHSSIVHILGCYFIVHIGAIISLHWPHWSFVALC